MPIPRESVMIGNKNPVKNHKTKKVHARFAKRDDLWNLVSVLK